MAEGELLIAGLANDAFSSTLRRARFPFAGNARATTLEIFHASMASTRRPRRSRPSCLTA